MWPFNKTETRSNPLENPTIPISDPRVMAFIFGDEGRATSGLRVTEDVALGVPAFWAGYNFLSMAFASFPIHVFQRNDDGTVERENSDLSRLLAKAPNPRWSSFRWRQYSMQRYLTNGRAITGIIRETGTDTIKRFIPANPAKVKITVEGDDLLYEIPGVAEKLKSADVLDIPWALKPDGVNHYNPIQKLRGTIALSVAYEKYRTRLFNNGGVPPLAFEGPFNSPESGERGAKDVNDAIQKASAEGKSGISIPLGHHITLLGFNPEQGQLIEALIYLLGEYARFFGLPPTFIQDLSKGTFANTEQAGLQIVKFRFAQLAELWEGEFDIKLFPKDNTRFVKLDLDGLLRGDFLSRMSGYATSIQNGIRTPNEVRKLEELPPDPAGNDLMIQGATVPLGSQPRNESSRDET